MRIVDRDGFRTLWREWVVAGVGGEECWRSSRARQLWQIARRDEEYRDAELVEMVHTTLIAAWAGGQVAGAGGGQLLQELEAAYQAGQFKSDGGEAPRARLESKWEGADGSVGIFLRTSHQGLPCQGKGRSWTGGRCCKWR